MSEENERVNQVEVAPSSDYYNKQYDAQMNFFKKHPWQLVLFLVAFFGVIGLVLWIFIS